MLSNKIVNMLNQQINLEFYSSNLYLQMGAWCAFKGLDGCAAFLVDHAKEEEQHMQKLLGYVSECGALPVLGTIAAPPTDYESVMVVFRKTLEHEIHVTSEINKLVGTALEERDFSTFNFLQWYVAEQHEEEKLFRGIVDKMQVIGAEGRGLYFFDKEIRKLAKPSPLAAT